MQPQPSNQNRKSSFRATRLIFSIGFLFIGFSPASIFARTLEQYGDGVRYARDLTVSMLYPDEDAAIKNAQKSESEIPAKIRKSLPESEEIEWRGASVETNNQWLREYLLLFESEPKNSPKRRLILTSIVERLDALEQKIKELENQPTPNAAGDEDKQKLAEILRRQEYQKPDRQDESFFQKLYRQLQDVYRKIMDWLESFFPRPNLSGSSTDGFASLSFILQMLLYALVLGVIAFLVYRFAPLLAGKFRRRQASEKRERVILGERIAAEETAENIFAEAEKLAREGNLRGAIRKGYIALLCGLGDRKIVRLAQSKTNRDYLRDVLDKKELYRNMNGLTLNFERHWYGFESANESDWEEFRNGYKKIITNYE